MELKSAFTFVSNTVYSRVINDLKHLLLNTYFYLNKMYITILKGKEKSLLTLTPEMFRPNMMPKDALHFGLCIFQIGFKFIAVRNMVSKILEIYSWMRIFISCKCGVGAEKTDFSRNSIKKSLFPGCVIFQPYHLRFFFYGVTWWVKFSLHQPHIIYRSLYQEEKGTVLKNLFIDLRKISIYTFSRK